MLFSPLLTVCGGSDDAPQGSSPAPDAGPVLDAAPPDAPPPDAPAPDADPPAPDLCAALGLAKQPFSEGPHGRLRGDIADDFTVELVDGSSWQLRARWTGCESYLFLPDTIDVSDNDPASIWEHDLDELVKRSPRNVHYFFVSREADEATATASTSAMQGRVDALMAALSPEDALHWRDHLHVVQRPAASLDGWLRDILRRQGGLGFGIDRGQRVRGVGLLADVFRFDPALQQAGVWPWRANLAYLANEARYFNARAERQARLDSEAATVVKLWDGEVLSEFAEVEATLPTAEEMAAFDTLEVEVAMSCPAADDIEFGNCGAWDCIASLFVQGESEEIELARFSTSYHRETHWVVDATPMLVQLREGGLRRFRWSFAPEWNPQPTATRLSLRFSNRDKGYAPAEATFLFRGKPFNAAYNDDRAPVEVPIPEDAKRVELAAIITGHGGATDNCAEFCNHQHEFTVNGATYVREFPSSGTADGCVDELEHGMVPNQGGTWWFGRGGWCPGQQVEPYVVDVTRDVTPGSAATVSYRGLHGGATPPDDAGEIVMVSYLVVYR